MIGTSAVGLVAAAPAALASSDDMFNRDGPTMSVTMTILQFVILPLAIFAVITLAVVGPSMGKGGRHRPGAALETGPVWVDPSGAAATVADPAVSESEDRPVDQGGAGAHW